MTLFLSLLGCPTTPSSTDPATSPGTDTDVPTETDQPPPTPTADTAPPVPTDPPIPTVDCTSPPAGPFSGRLVQTARAYHGLAFDPDGNLVGGDNTNLLKTAATNDTSLFVPNLGSAQQMNYLPNGDLAIAVNGGGLIQRIEPSGNRVTLASGINAYGVEVGPDGQIYTANQSNVHRIDPTGTNGPQVIIGGGAVSTPKVLAFNLDGSELFVGTNFSSGAVHRFEIGTDGDPILPGQLIANTGGSWHDGLGMDACGRLYVAEYNTRSLYMIEPGQGSTQLLDYYSTPLGGSSYGHGLEWGSGLGEWDDHFLYVPMPYNGNTVAEIELGVPWIGWNDGNYERIE